MTVGSLFSGIGGFDLGMERAGFDVRWQIEINGDCIKVLSRHWPDVRRYRDINAMVYGRHRNRQKHGLLLEPVDVICGGFPCQDLSVAGKREGLAGSRSGLFFAFMRVVRLLKPKVVLIENVPGLLSSQRGRDFYTVLSQVAECGFRRAYRILDSQHFGIPQRRRRVFIVGCARDLSLRPDAVLFESARCDGDSQTRTKARPRIAATLRGRSHRAGVNAPGRGGEDDVNLVTGPLGGGNDGIGRRSEDDPNLVYCIEDAGRKMSGGSEVGLGVRENISYTLNAAGRHAVAALNSKQYEGVLIERARALTGSMFKRHDDDTDTLIPIVGATLNGNSGRNHIEQDYVPVASAITASAGHHGHSSPRGDGQDNLVYPISGDALRGDGTALTPSPDAEGRVRLRNPGLGVGAADDPAFTLSATSPGAVGVRRLTPLECERLQGFPDGWTCLCGEGHRGTAFCSCDDTYRYKGLGNAVSVPVSEWIARRLKAAMEATA